jgi:hypothetical protein
MCRTCLCGDRDGRKSKWDYSGHVTRDTFLNPCRSLSGTRQPHPLAKLTFNIAVLDM